ncbi:MAG: 5'-3' exonuclease H3TH domain-containing protein [Polyangiaceae bacterium]
MRLHLVDGTYELFRAHFSKRPDQTDPKGRDVKATTGVVSSILALLDDPDEQVTHLAVAFDNPVRSFRNDLFDGYKTEEGVAEELLAQFDLVEVAMRAIGVVAWSMDRWEADDAHATAAARWGGEVDQVRILTPDKDLGQCIRGERVVQVDRMRKKLIDEAGLLALRGIVPASIPDYLALVGDTADGIPGIKGFGEKTAASLLREYVHVEQIPARARDWKVSVRGADTLAPLLAASREEVLLYRKLATLVTDVPLAESLEDLRWGGVPRAAFSAWCDDLGVSEGMRGRPSRFA